MPAARVPGRALLRAAAFGAAVVLPVVALAVAVRGGSGAVVRFDEATVAAATDVTRSSDTLRTALVGWQEVFAARWLNLVLVPAVGAWAWRRDELRDRVVWAGVTVAVGWGLQHLAKLVVQRARPVIDDAVAHAPGWSFPSGHAANTTTVAVVLTVLVWPVLGRAGRVAVPTVAGLLVALTVADRVLLGVHYPSDVVAGVLFGTAVAGASYLGWRRSPPDERHGTGRTAASAPTPEHLAP
ncbi:phosphoesterase PA-phosphatase related protein [Cellulomonas flavigena DSM 20109]|uniref:Phosphoesterase PA-phosphatase related protein n=1 Tax=Cellulomonas flavigena (strain ATCC 482 / DSM 20109 / BCRC 11376 / JCM 18109 / NBRC 3775 / NCIMB 8073 / NRS 134) TaxID=446466 RepID=D5UG31_CELFN|nr:phosphatase PAP2 family protein [Cellulomonas flavigena]ADG75054.1 phosphoesterase PA-phosphatase related protein [Cellulomonas flavigena DSM 20109]